MSFRDIGAITNKVKSGVERERGDLDCGWVMIKALKPSREPPITHCLVLGMQSFLIDS